MSDDLDLTLLLADIDQVLTARLADSLAEALRHRLLERIALPPEPMAEA